MILELWAGKTIKGSAAWAALRELGDKDAESSVGDGGLECEAAEGLGSFRDILDFHTAGIVFYPVVLILT